MAVIYSILVIVFISLYLLYRIVTKHYNHWAKKNVPHEKPIPFFGNFKDYILLKEHHSLIAHKICQKFPNEPYVGTYYGTDPALMVKDPNIVKLVMTKDFYYFHEREVSEYNHIEPLTQNMFFSGGDYWRVIRQNSTALFTSSKLKNMFYLIENCANNLEKVIEHECKLYNGTVNIKEILARYTMDCIGSCAFGINTRTLENNSKNNPFFAIGSQIFDASKYGGFRIYARSMWPALFYGLGLKMLPLNINNFFKTVIADVFKSRNYKPTTRNDFVDLILGWKDDKYLVGDSIHNLKSDGKVTKQIEIDDSLLISQCVIIFAAGFETTSTATSLLLYELSKHPEVQERVINEVDSYFVRHSGKIEFECISEMPFLQACVDETFRLYPVLGLLTREVAEDYTLPTGLHLEKGTRIHIPVYHIHHNPKLFPEPEKFRPDRFYGEENKKVVQYSFLPFGAGPRICIGLRFAKMPLYSGVLTILRKYRVELGENMPTSINIDPNLNITQPIGNIYLKFIPRQNI